MNNPERSPMKVRLAAALMLLVAVTPLPGRASTVRAIDVRNVEFEPGGGGAVAGDTITWTWRSGSHTVTAYKGASFDQQLSGGAFSTFSYNYTGGLLLYYCKIHSTVNPANETCDGPMCGRVSDTPPVVTPPQITYPSDGSTFSSHALDIGGTVEFGVRRVRVKEGQATLGTASVTGQGWTQFLDLSNGAHVITAIAIDELGFESARSTPVTINIASPDDDKPPILGMSSPRDTAAAGPVSVRVVTGTLTVAGDAIDADTFISSLTVTITDPAGDVLENDWDCTGKCGTAKKVHYIAYADALPGRYLITVVATDSAQNKHSATLSKDVIVLV
jgi:plastocyanin